MASPVQPDDQIVMLIVTLAWAAWAYYIITGEGLAMLLSTFLLLLLGWFI